MTKPKIKRKIFVVGGDYYYANWMEGEIVHDMPSADLVVFTGGEDVSPIFYGHISHEQTFCNPERDRIERLAHLEAFDLAKPTVGICRGAQFLCVMAGGWLVQHQLNPGYTHDIFTEDQRMITVTSLHHQAMYPWNLPAEDRRIIAWSRNCSRFHENGNCEEMVEGNACVTLNGIKVYPNGREIEICYFKMINALGIQSHPEMMMREYSTNQRAMEYIEYCRELLNNLMLSRF